MKDVTLADVFLADVEAREEARSMTEPLSGLALRKAVAEKLGYRVEQAQMSFWVVIDPEGHDLHPVSGGSSEEQAWSRCPAFESSLGALQDAGVIRALFPTEEYRVTMVVDRTKISDYEGDMGPRTFTLVERANDPASALATALCRAYVSMPVSTEGTEG